MARLTRRPPRRPGPARSPEAGPAARRLASVVAPGLAVGVAAAALAWVRAGAPEVLELALYDTRAAYVARRHPASSSVVLVAVDDEAVRLAGGVHPLPRGALAAVVEEARGAGARAIAVDFILGEPLEGSRASENAYRGRAIAGGGVALAVAVPRAGP